MTTHIGKLKLSCRRPPFLPSAVYRLPPAVCRLASAVWRLPPDVCRLPAV